MKVCRACCEKINVNATICPHCRTKQARTKRGFLAGIVIIGVLVFFTFGNRSGSSSIGSNTDASSTVGPDDVTFIKEHGNDPKALDERFSNKAQIECSSRTDDYLRSIASHDFAWDEEAKGWLGEKFDKYSLRSPGFGMLSLLSTRAKLSNGFGAFQHINFYCLYNAATGDFVRFSQSDPADEIASVAASADTTKLANAAENAGIAVPAETTSLTEYNWTPRKTLAFGGQI